MEKSNKKLGIALLGLGKYATEQLAPALQQTNHCYLAAIVTGDDNKAKQWKEKYKLDEQCVYDYDNFDTIRANPAVDIVYIVTPNALHADFVVRAAKAGKHVICEKPMATTLEDCDRMIEACKNNGVTLSVGYRLHFEPYNQEMMRLGNTHKLGYVQQLIARDGIEGASGWRLDPLLAGKGGPLMDLGIYCMQASNYVYNMSPIAVTAQQAGQTVSFQLEYPGGFTSDCCCSFSNKMNYLHAAANNGWFELKPAFGYAGIKGKTSIGELHFDQVNQQALEMDTISKAILLGEPTPVPGEMGRDDVVILLAINEALESGARILLHPANRQSATTETGGVINGAFFTVEE
ncbi:MAG: Gfo/Idh/MocA family oxidoreductase [Chitinophagaceae bacterium]